MKTKTRNKISSYSPAQAARNRPAVALVVALVILVVLSAIVYTLSSRLAEIKHRQQYIIDYQIARYAGDSAMKYALAKVKEINLKLIKRKNKLDFSDLFTMNRDEYTEYLYDWAQKLAKEKGIENLSADLQSFLDPDAEVQTDNSLSDPLGDLFTGLNKTDPNELDDDDWMDQTGPYGIGEPNDLEIPGPYGPQWPYVTEPIEFEIGSAKIKITIEDENAKMPLTWAITTEKNVNRKAQAALETFCQWMQMETYQIKDLADQLKEITGIKQFKLNLKDITATKRVSARSRSSRARRRGSSRSKIPSRTTTTKTTVRSAVGHTTDFAKLLHSSMLDTETLAAPLPDTGSRLESPMKYLALWGSQRVNINTAPRHVLEAAFTFGGDAEDIAEEIIQLRRERPFKNLKDLKSRLYGFNDSIKKTTPYITTVSTYLLIRVTATNGRARSAAVATVIKNGNKVERIAIITQ
jgi:uncharacterized membrane protein YhiD involved in acid resistance/DNA uptake protein ComE-like DNA-binding protein